MHDASSRSLLSTLTSPLRLIAAGSLLALAAAAPLSAQQVEPEVFTLDNGMKFLLLPRTDQPNVIAAGWVAKVGSVNERPASRASATSSST